MKRDETNEQTQPILRAGLTPRQHEALHWIAAYMRETGGISPSYEEIRQGLGLVSKNGVHRVVHALEERGYIRFIQGKPRSIIVLD